MKKTFAILAAMAASLTGSALADDLQPVYTLSNVNIGTVAEYDISSLGLNTTDGYTLMFTVDWTTRGNGTLLWVSNTHGEAAYVGNTSDGQLYATAVMGYSSASDKQMAVTYNGTAGTAVAGTKPASPVTLPSHEGGLATLFLTCQDGTATLYELASDGKLYQTSSYNGNAVGDVASIVIGNWAATRSSVQGGTMDLAVYSGVLSMQQMTDLVPEPTTATLSLLALAGLAARRRRR